jgi:hypothetical protein
MSSVLDRDDLARQILVLDGSAHPRGIVAPVEVKESGVVIHSGSHLLTA